ncbi:hypothetical protein PENANT_c004G10576 [Penicillium antarcticum]|uniref:DNA topoisomerase (ATP-hydrolyzing) n=1 Tax=Penicillium antarcticum TaxID=416450 RepID=A0A1V6QGG9_9EURO|nr:hypothetical protein PENANT_c004G10576 [Penicillium antarcticum]
MAQTFATEYSSREITRDPTVRAFIDNTLTDLVHELSLSPTEAHPSITLKRRANPAACVINPINGALEANLRAETYKTYSWPGTTAFEAWKFTVILRILAIIDKAIRSGQSISKRDIYYIDPQYFRSQQTVNGVIDDLVYTIGVDRAALNVEAAAKGLIAGCLRLIRDSQVVVNAQSATEDTLIPRIENDDEIDISRARWVLVIEKEGKGYPDLSTREFLHKLSNVASNQNRPPLRFYGLTDGDPHGMAILSTYKYGSAAHVHENARLILPRLQWLGVRVTDIIAVPDAPGYKALLSLTPQDRSKIVAMLRNSPVWASDGPALEWRVELQRMLMLNLKAEIEILYD